MNPLHTEALRILDFLESCFSVRFSLIIAFISCGTESVPLYNRLQIMV